MKTVTERKKPGRKKGPVKIKKTFALTLPVISWLKKQKNQTGVVESALKCEMEKFEQKNNKEIEPDFEAMGYCPTCSLRPCRCDEMDEKEAG